MVDGLGFGDFEQSAQGGQVEFVVVTQRTDHRGKFAAVSSGEPTPRKSLLGGGPHWYSPEAAQRRPARLQRVVEHVAVGEVLDQERTIRVAPVVEDLAALDVAADAP